METSIKSSTKRKRRRTQAQIDIDITEAFERLVCDRGFNEISLRQLLEEADINPSVFYRRFNSVEEFTTESIKTHDLWLNETLDMTSIHTLGIRKYYTHGLKSYFKELRNNKFMQQLMLWELCEDNEVTRRSASVRESLNMSLLLYYNQHFSSSGMDVQSISTILFAGLTFLTLRMKHPMYCNLNLNSPEAEQAIEGAIDELGALLFDAHEKGNLLRQSILKMQKDGITPAKICDYLNLTESRYKRLLSNK